VCKQQWLRIPDTLGIEVEVQANGGTVWLTGVIEFPELMPEIFRVAGSVSGVEEGLTDFTIRPVPTAAEL
jgi:osmotically-inducible protein OsmY